MKESITSICALYPDEEENEGVVAINERQVLVKRKFFGVRSLFMIIVERWRARATRQKISEGNEWFSIA
jgi:hypothetical protein